MITVSRYHDICAGHRVYGHEGKCKNLHGHNYRIHFEVAGPDQDEQGRIIDFSFIKSALCDWLENRWDHKMLIWENDPILGPLYGVGDPLEIIAVPFNPTAENMAKHLVQNIGPVQLKGSGCVLIRCIVEETRKCSALYTHDAWVYGDMMAQDLAFFAAREKINHSETLSFDDLPF